MIKILEAILDLDLAVHFLRTYDQTFPLSMMNLWMVVAFQEVIQSPHTQELNNHGRKQVVLSSFQCEIADHFTETTCFKIAFNPNQHCIFIQTWSLPASKTTTVKTAKNILTT